MIDTNIAFSTLNQIVPVFKSVGHIVSKNKLTIPIHQHFEYHVIYVFDGSYEYLHNNTKNKLHAGQGVLIRPDDWHLDILYKGTDYAAVNFILKHDNEILKRNIDEKCLVFNDDKQIISSIYNKILKEREKSDSVSSCLLNTYSLELFWSIIRLLPESIKNSDSFVEGDKQLFQNELKKLFHQNIHNMLTLEQIAEKMNITPRTLHNKSHNYLGLSPIKAFMKLKMEHALEMLKHTGMSIKEISDYLGFQNPYHFSKVFKRFFEYSPGNLRK